ncbi:glycosyltransferase family 8 protein [Psittacicella hinzii]|uniref:General stress protein A n=1 Tax=Psittacicella hinzii TaxID=2028575 RepID=A0A3A1YPY1_9GAMM|nr:glycosyltransferase [Psittacicella hinzii]RIY39309.1 hypothetical protein CKF58_02390 [Psittacicella hinzii]
MLFQQPSVNTSPTDQMIHVGYVFTQEHKHLNLVSITSILNNTPKHKLHLHLTFDQSMSVEQLSHELRVLRELEIKCSIYDLNSQVQTLLAEQETAHEIDFALLPDCYQVYYPLYQLLLIDEVVANFPQARNLLLVRYDTLVPQDLSWLEEVNYATIFYDFTDQELTFCAKEGQSIPTLGLSTSDLYAIQQLTYKHLSHVNYFPSNGVLYVNLAAWHEGVNVERMFNITSNIKFGSQIAKKALAYLHSEQEFFMQSSNSLLASTFSQYWLNFFLIKSNLVAFNALSAALQDKPSPYLLTIEHLVASVAPPATFKLENLRKQVSWITQQGKHLVNAFFTLRADSTVNDFSQRNLENFNPGLSCSPVQAMFALYYLRYLNLFYPATPNAAGSAYVQYHEYKRLIETQTEQSHHVHIVLSFNQAYYGCALACIESLLHYRSLTTHYHIYIMYRDLNPEDLAYLEQRITWDGSKVHLINMQEYLEQFPFEHKRHISIDTFSRLFIPDIFAKDYPEVEQILYLDIDTLIVNDLGDFAGNFLPEEQCFAATSDEYAYDCLTKPYLAENKEHIQHFLRFCQPNPASLYDITYFNAGVIFWNLKHWYAKQHPPYYLVERMAQIHQDQDTLFQDQDLLNIIAQENSGWMQLHRGLNYINKYPLNYTSELPLFRHCQVEDDQRTLFVLHYAGPNKPWHNLFYATSPWQQQFMNLALHMKYYFSQLAK